MPDRYWVGGTASWDGTAGTKWAATSGGAGGASVPTSADAVFFDANSGASVVTIAAGNTGAASINCTGFTGTITGSAAITVSGSVTLVAAMTYTHSGTMTFNGTGTITTAGKTFSPTTVNGSGITVTLGDAFSTGGNLTVTLGTFTTNGFALTVSELSSSNFNTRTINLGASTVTLTSGLNFAISTGLTFNAGTSQINRSGFVFTFSGGGRTFNNVTFTNFTGGTIEGTNTFANLSVTGSGASPTTYTINFGANQTITGTLTLNGASAISRLRTSSNDVTRPRRTISAGTLVSTDCDFEDFGLTGTAAPASPTRAGNRGNNNNITFPAAKTVYRVGTNTTWTGSASWATTSGGTGNNDNYPLIQDTAVIDNSTALTGTLTISNVSLSNIDCSTRTTAITLNNGAGVELLGNYRLGSGVTLSGSSVTVSGHNRNIDITSAGVNIPFGFDIRAGASGALVYLRLLDACSIGSIQATYGSVNLNGFNLTIGSYNSSNPFFTNDLTFNGGTMTITGSGTAFNVTSTNFTTTVGTGSGTINMTSASAKTFAGNGRTYNCTLNNGGAGALTITGSNVFTTLSNSVQPTTFTFTAGTTTTLTNWNINGTTGNLVTIGSATAASHTLSKSSGTVNADFLSISRSTATGGATWNAGANSTDGGNNTGWIFGAAAAGAGNFLSLFL